MMLILKKYLVTALKMKILLLLQLRKEKARLEADNFIRIVRLRQSNQSDLYTLRSQ